MNEYPHANYGSLRVIQESSEVQLPAKEALLKLVEDFLHILESEIFSEQSAINFVNHRDSQFLAPDELLLRILSSDYRNIHTGELSPAEIQAAHGRIQEKISEFLNKYGHMFHYDEFRKIFDREQIFGYVSKEGNGEIKRLIDIFSHVVGVHIFNQQQNTDNRRYQIETAQGKCANEISRLSEYNPNIVGYIIFRMFYQTIQETKQDYEIFNCVQILQNSSLVQGSILEKWINDFLGKYTSLLSSSQIWSLLISSDEWKEKLQEVFRFPETSSTRFEVCANIIVYEEGREKLSPYKKQAFEGCIAYMKKAPKKNQHELYQDSLIKIYKYWKSISERYSPEENLRIEKAFERYGKAYPEDSLFLNQLHSGDLPTSFIIKSAREEFRAILGNIEGIRKRRQEGVGSERNSVDSIYLLYNSSRMMSEPYDYGMTHPSEIYEMNTLLPYNLPASGDLVDWNRYMELRKQKPEQGSENGKELQEIRKFLRLTTDSVAVRQWLYQTLVWRVTGYSKSQTYPRFDEGTTYKNTHRPDPRVSQILKPQIITEVPKIHVTKPREDIIRADEGDDIPF